MAVLKPPSSPSSSTGKITVAVGALAVCLACFVLVSAIRGRNSNPAAQLASLAAPSGMPSVRLSTPPAASTAAPDHNHGETTFMPSATALQPPRRVRKPPPPAAAPAGVRWTTEECWNANVLSFELWRRGCDVDGKGNVRTPARDNVTTANAHCQLLANVDALPTPTANTTATVNVTDRHFCLMPSRVRWTKLITREVLDAAARRLEQEEKSQQQQHQRCSAADLSKEFWDEVNDTDTRNGNLGSPSEASETAGARRRWRTTLSRCQLSTLLQTDPLTVLVALRRASDGGRRPIALSGDSVARQLFVRLIRHIRGPRVAPPRPPQRTMADEDAGTGPHYEPYGTSWSDFVYVVRESGDEWRRTADGVGRRSPGRESFYKSLHRMPDGEATRRRRPTPKQSPEQSPITSVRAMTLDTSTDTAPPALRPQQRHAVVSADHVRAVAEAMVAATAATRRHGSGGLKRAPPRTTEPTALRSSARYFAAAGEVDGSAPEPDPIGARPAAVSLRSPRSSGVPHRNFRPTPVPELPWPTPYCAKAEDNADEEVCVVDTERAVGPVECDPDDVADPCLLRVQFLFIPLETTFLANDLFRLAGAVKKPRRASSTESPLAGSASCGFNSEPFPGFGLGAQERDDHHATMLTLRDLPTYHFHGFFAWALTRPGRGPVKAAGELMKALFEWKRVANVFNEQQFPPFCGFGGSSEKNSSTDETSSGKRYRAVGLTMPVPRERIDRNVTTSSKSPSHFEDRSWWPPHIHSRNFVLKAVAGVIPLPRKDNDTDTNATMSPTERFAGTVRKPFADAAVPQWIRQTARDLAHKVYSDRMPRLHATLDWGGLVRTARAETLPFADGMHLPCGVTAPIVRHTPTLRPTTWDANGCAGDLDGSAITLMLQFLHADSTPLSSPNTTTTTTTPL